MEQTKGIAEAKGQDEHWRRDIEDVSIVRDFREESVTTSKVITPRSTPRT